MSQRTEEERVQKDRKEKCPKSLKRKVSKGFTNLLKKKTKSNIFHENIMHSNVMPLQRRLPGEFLVANGASELPFVETLELLVPGQRPFDLVRPPAIGTRVRT